MGISFIAFALNPYPHPVFNASENRCMHMADTLKIPDRRKATRFQVALPVEWPEGTGITRDLSAGGVFLRQAGSSASGRSSSLLSSWNTSIRDSQCARNAAAGWYASNGGAIPWEWQWPLWHTGLTRSRTVGWRHEARRFNKIGGYTSPFA